MNPTSIELHIEELELHGFSTSDAFRIGKAIEKAIERVFWERGLPVGLVGELEISELDLGTFVLSTNPAPHTIGNGVSKALHRALLQPPSSNQSSTSQPMDSHE